MRVNFVLACLLTSVVFAGCVGPPTSESPNAFSKAGAKGPRSPFEDAPPVWNQTGGISHPLRIGTLEVLPVERVDIPSFDGTLLAATIWRPKLPESEKVPVLLDVGPYWASSIDRLAPNGREQLLYVDGLVKHGYAYGRVAVRGTSESGGCSEFFSLSEQRDMDETINWFAKQPWSNGNVGFIGLSYDGTTPFEAATWGNPHLKTIIPISGIPDLFDLSFRNGTGWNIGPAVHAAYWVPEMFHPQQEGAAKTVANANCPEGYIGVGMSQYSAVTGDREEPVDMISYWEDRDFRQRIKDHYKGSIFLVHGLQDWRISPHVVFPFVSDLQDQGLDVKVLIGQWWHDQPDRGSRAVCVRWDYGEYLLRWLDKYLKELPDVDTGPPVDVCDSQYLWRTEEHWPPKDPTWTTYYLGAQTVAEAPQPPGEKLLFNPANAASLVGERVGPDSPLDYRASFGKLEKELRFSGMAQLPVGFTPLSPEGSRVYAELIDVSPNGQEYVIAHAVMDLRYYKGGYEPQTLLPGEPLVAMMEFLPADVVIPAGHELVLRIVGGAGYGNQRTGYAMASSNQFKDTYLDHPVPKPALLRWGGESSRIILPLIDRDVGDGKYPGQP